MEEFPFFVVWSHTYVPRKLEFRTGFHLASSMLLLLYLAAMRRSVSYFLVTSSVWEEKKKRTLLCLRQFHKYSLPETIKKVNTQHFVSVTPNKINCVRRTHA